MNNTGIACLGGMLLLALQATTGVQANDRCLVGTWEPQGNAMADWMKRQNLPMAMSFRQETASLSFRADGSYSADMRGSATARGSDGISARAGGQFGGDGRWSTADGKLVLVQGNERSDVEMEVRHHRGPASRKKLPKGAGGPQAFGYSCAGGRMETRLQIPGSTDPVVQPYRRR